jgi:transcription elongation factor GreA
MTLALHFQQDNWEALEISWTEMMAAGAPLEPVLEVLDLAAERKVMPRCVGLVREHATLLRGASKNAEAAELLGRALLGGGSPGELAGELVKAAHAAWSAEDWWSAYAELAGLHENSTDVRAAWRNFRKLLGLKPDAVVLHASGWGMGRILELDRASLEIAVQFQSGRKDRFPVKSAIAIFDVLEDEDLRALVVRDPAALKKMVQSEPLEVLTRLLRRYGGRASHAVLKAGAAQIGLEGSAFSSWWRRTRPLAETSPWFEVTGNATKAQVRLLARAADPLSSLKRQLRLAPSLANAQTRVRDLLAGKGLEPAMREAALDTIEELAAQDSQPLAERLAAWMLLREQRKVTPPQLAARLERAAASSPVGEGAEAPGLWKFFAQFTGAREQERCIDFLIELHGEPEWLDVASRSITHAPPGMARALIDAFLERDRGAEMVKHYASLLARPTRNPHVLLALAEPIENGRAKGEMPGPLQRAQALLLLAVYLHEEAPGDTWLGRARARLTNLLAGTERPLLRRLLERADRTSLKGFLSIVQRGVDDPIESLLTDIVVEQAPEIFRELEKPFWERGAVWTTRRGLERREAELRELKDVKIPANAEAIGRAASYGDLSENSEWEAAIEEQRTLTTRAMEMEQELRGAQLLENAALPDETVAPGTGVSYRDLATGQTHDVTLLGPWDLGEEGVMSYRAPLAAGLLGLRKGQRSRIELPGGAVEVEVLDIRLAQL